MSLVVMSGKYNISELNKNEQVILEFISKKYWYSKKNSIKSTEKFNRKRADYIVSDS